MALSEWNLQGPCSAASSGFATSAGASRRDFKSKEELMKYLGRAGSNGGYDTVIEFPTTAKQDKVIYNNAMEKGKNFSSYKLIGNSCGIYAQDVLISAGTGIFEPSVSKFDLYGILDKNAPYAIGDRLFDENSNAIMFEIKK